MRRKWRRNWARNKANLRLDSLLKPFQEFTPWKTLAKRLLPPLTAAGFLLNSLGIAYALPTDVITQAGNVTVSQSGNTMTVHETSATGIVSSRTFVINADETLNIYQPSSSATLLWRVAGHDPSVIYGHVNANGQLFLYNPQGTLFARGAEFNGGSLVATSLNITDSDFLAGNYKFNGASTNGAVINQGTLTAANGGYIALLGPQVSNEGIIVAQQGTVALGAGSAVTLDMAGDGLLSLAVDRAAVDRAAVDASAANHNLMQADGGQVIMTASAAGDLIRTAVNNSGVILARSAQEVDGVILLDAGTNGTVVNSGTLDASGKGTGETGGTVKVLGQTVTLADGTQIDAGGDSGGGTVLVGGNYQGQGTEQHATTTTVAPGATINADAITQGKGGQVVVWADGTTNYGGTVSARGGSVGGDGGTVETSGKQTLIMTGNVNAGASHGRSGSWLLDPADYTIDATAAANIAYSLNNGTDVTITTSASGPDTGDITVANAVSWTSGNSLTLKADNDINVNNTITSTGSGNVVLRADSDANSSGTVSFGTNGQVVTDGMVSIYYNPSGTTSVEINGTDTTVKDYTKPTDYTNYVKKTSGDTGNLTAYMLVNNLNELQAISVNTSGTYALGKDIDASTTSTWNNGAGFTPIGSFRGILDGDGHAISGLHINDATDTYVGLIGYVDSGTIRNLGLENVDINSGKGGQRVAGLAGGLSGGSITNSYVTGTVTGCLSSASSNVGGLAGFIENGGTITNSYSAAVVQGYTASNIGGLVGENSGGTIIDSYSSGAVTGSGSGSNIGGLVGNDWVGWGYDGSNELAGKISGSYSSGAVISSGSSSCAGGLVGRDGGATISGSYSSGAVTNSGSSSYAGGLVGNFGGKITDSYSSGAVTNTGSGSYVGGLVGYHSSNSPISGSYSSGAVISTGSGSYAGGFVGRTDDANAITTSYWDSDSSGQQSGSGDGSSIAGLTKLSASDKDPYSENSYSGFDFGTTWYMIDGDTRPFLRSEYSTTITNAHQLQLMAMDLSATYTLAGNIDLTGFDMGRNGCFVAIGTSSTFAFSGSLDGNGYAVNNLTINGSTADAVGLFGYIGQSGSVSNIGLYNANVTGGANNTYVGSLAGYNAGSITNVYSTGTVSGGGTVGGLVGLNNGTVQTAYTTSQVTVTGSSGTAGGLVGENDGEINNVYSTGKVSGTAGSTLGGLVGNAGSGSSIANAYWDTNTSGVAAGVGSGSSTGAMGLTTTQMMDKAYLTTLGFDFTDTWYMVDGSTRPFLWSENVTTISNAHQLQLMGANLSTSYILGSDVDLSELKDAAGMWNTTTGFAPVGSNSAPFTGALDGKGHTISGLTVNNTALTAVGLFGYVKDAIISDISLSNASITAGSGSYAGGLAGENDGGSITDVYVSGTVTSSGMAGGLVGLNTGSIDDSYSTGTVSVSGDGSVAGGVAGSNTGTISGSYNAGTVSGSGPDEQVGGVAGTNTGSITGSYNAAGGVVSVSSDGSMAGGVAGSNTGTISSSYNAGTVSGSGPDEQVGGVAGTNTNTGSITNSYNLGTVTGSGINERVGGVAGANAGSIASSYNAGTITGSGINEWVGGLAGVNTGSILCSYGAAAAVVSSTADSNIIGGVAGENDGSIIGSFNNGRVNTSADAIHNKAGGVVGLNTVSGSLDKSYNTGTVSVGGDNSSAGGLVGDNAGRIESSTSSGAVTTNGIASPTGGLVGVNSSTGTVTTSFSVGNVSGKDRVGGLVGDNAGNITNSYFAVGTATGSGSASKTGGLVGVNSGTITTSFSSGGVTGDGLVGGLVGERTGGTITDAVWDVDKSGQQYGVGSDPAVAGVTGLTTVKTRIAANYPDDWDFTDTWTLTSTGPRLQWQDQTTLTITTLSTIDVAAATSIDNTLNGGTDVTLVTSPGSANSGDINVDSSLSWASDNTLTLSAYRDVNVNAGITSTGGGNVVLRADNTGNDTGTVNFGANGKVVTDGAVSIYYNPSGLTTATVNGTGILMKDYTNPTDYTGYVRKYTSDETGDVTAYMLVNNVSQLQAININLFDSYALGRDIDASATRNWNSGAGFTPIGDHSEYTWLGEYYTSDFRGIFDGDGHTISGLYINKTDGSYAGLFGYVSGAIHNLGLTNVNITGTGWTGGLVGYSSGAITNCYVTGTVNGNGSGIGGLVGYSSGTITDSYSAALVTATNAQYAGGLVGENDGNITDSYSIGTTSSSGTAFTGGLAGVNSGGTISNSYSTGSVTGNINVSWFSYGGTGGLVGYNTNGGMISNSYSTGAVIGNITLDGWFPYGGTGGLVGINSGGTIVDSYSSGAVTGSVTVTGENQYGGIGGLVGYNNGGTISGSYSAGAVTGSGSYIGGFIGGTDNPDGITASYWDSDSSGRQTGSGDGSSIAGLTGLSASGKDPYSESSYSNFDFGTTWYMIDGYTRPFLKWEYSTTITNAHQLQLMSMDLSATYTLAANIDMSGYNMARNGFVPIGTDSTSAFTGTLDGNGYVVSNLSITGLTTDAAGLFGYIGQSGIVSDIGLYDVNITGGTGSIYVGSLAGDNAGSITNAYSTGAVRGSGIVGGLVGRNTGTVQDAYTTSEVAVTGSSGTGGGLAGENDGELSSVYSTGAVSGVAGSTLGGLVGSAGAGSTFSDAYWDTDTSGQTTGVGSGSDSGATGLTTAQMRDEDYLATLGFNFTDTWYMVDGLTRPFLRSENVTTVSNAHQLQLMGVNLSAHYTLDNNIELSELNEASGMWNTATGFAPVGSSNAPFTGTLWGDGRTISGLTVNNTALTAVGLFGYIKDAEISRIVLDNANITAGSGSYAGALVGENDGGSITDVWFSGTVAGSGTTGGLVGLNAGSIQYGYNTGVISVSGDGSVAGGVAGSNTGTISDSYNAGTVTGSDGNEQVGGVAGVNTGSIADSYNATGGTVSVSGDGSIAGGVAGSNTGTISDSYNAGTVTGSGNAEQVGGVAGLNIGSITGSYNASDGGMVSISGDGSIAGGVAGSNTGTITGSYNAAGKYKLNDDGTVTEEIAVAAGAVSGSGTNEQVGGVAGQNSGSITGSTNAGTVSIAGKGSAVGGVAGVNTATGTISGSYNVEVKTVATDYGASKPDAVYTAGTVTSSGGDSFVGGLVGKNAGTVTSSYNWGPVTALGSGNTVGGLVGWNEQGGSIDNSYSGLAAVTVSGDNNITGGLVGQNDGGIAYTFAITPLFVSGTGSKVGALVGVNGTGGTMSNSFWNADISGLSSAVGSGSDDGVTGKTIAEMMQSSTYAGWDLTNTWNIASGYSFPYLSGQYSDYKWWNGQVYNYPTPSFISGIVEGGGTGETVVINASCFWSQTFSTKTVSASGFYYTLVPAGMAATQQANYSWVVLYITGDSNYKANAVYQYGQYGLADGNLIKDTLIDNYDGTGSRYGYFDSVLNHLPTLPTADSLYSYANGNLVVNGNLMINYVGGSSELDVIDTPLTATGDITITTAGNLLFATKANGDLAASATIGGYNSHTGAKLTAGGNITIVADNGFLNNVGADLFNLTGSGRWLVYAPNPLLTQYDLLFACQDKYIKYLVKTGEQSFWTTYFKTYFGQLLAPSRELLYDGRGGLTGDFVLWGTAYGDAVPATGSGFVYTALDPVIRPLTTGQQQLTAAVTEAYVDDAGAQAPVVPAAASSLRVTIRSQGVAVAPDDSAEVSGEQSDEQDQPKQKKTVQSSSNATTDTTK